MSYGGKYGEGEEETGIQVKENLRKNKEREKGSIKSM
jgi:hypothetical protein